jgi:glycosyltransferase involved in cell wall biosynthesis
MGKERILVSPNGIPSEVLWFKTNTMKIEGAIAFWGSLSFLPNRIAVEYFYHQVFVSYLADTPITWYIIGKNPEQWIRDLPLRHRNIKVTGYIDDLYGLISRIPIMINPMQIGGGIKNKVLEAFALERLVISTSLGMEAIPAQPGIHYIQADKSKEFANFIKQYASDVQAQHTIGQQAKSFVMQNYTWRTLGDQFNNLINQCLSSRQQNYSIKDNKTVKIFRKGNKYY